MRKKVLKRKQERLLKKKAELLERSNASNDVNEVRAINEQLTEIAEELRDIADELEALKEEGSGKDDGDSGADVEAEGRSEPLSNVEQRGQNVMGAFKMGASQKEERTDVLESMEYRRAFIEYFRSGDRTQINELSARAAEEGMVLTTDVGAIIPKTIMKEFIKRLKSYGGIYNRVRKMNVRGGVEFPIEDLVPSVHWITETETKDTQSAPELKHTISFGYHIAEAKIGQSLLSVVVTLDELENEIAELLAEAMVKEFDSVIVNGSGSGQPLGILNDTRVKKANVVEVTEEEMADWTMWRKKLFSKIPIRYRGEGLLVMTAATWESNILTMRDDNNRPLYTETYNPMTGEVVCRFNGREVELVEPDIVKDFDAAANGEVFGFYFRPKDYVINSNMQVGIKRYFDEDKNKWISKALTIADGKLLDVESVFVLKKKIKA